MASLGDVLGGILNQINKGRSQADVAALEIANIYKDHPLLSSFPIPRVTLEEVTIDLKMSIAQVPSKHNYFSPIVRSEIIRLLKTEITGLAEKEPQFGSFLSKSGEFNKLWQELQIQSLEKISGLIPLNSEADPQILANSIATFLSNDISKIIARPETHLGINALREFSSKISPQLETNFKNRLLELINQILDVNKSTQDRFEILVATEELEKIPPEKITTMKFSIKESDRSWTKIETEAGGMMDRLIPL